MTAPRDRTIALRGIVAAVVAAALNAALVPVARALELAPGFEPISYTPVVFLTVLGVIAGTFVFAAVKRLTLAPAQWFLRLAVLALAISFVPDLILLNAEPAATVPGVLVLMLMHVIAAALAVGLLTRGVEDSPAASADTPTDGSPD